METSGVLALVRRFLPTARRLKTLDLVILCFALCYAVGCTFAICFSEELEPSLARELVAFSVFAVAVTGIIMSICIKRLRMCYDGDECSVFLEVAALAYTGTVWIAIFVHLMCQPADNFADLLIPSLLVVCLGVFGALFFLAVLWIGVGNHLNRVWWRQQNQTLSAKWLPEISFQEFMTTKEG